MRVFTQLDTGKNLSERLNTENQSGLPRLVTARRAVGLLSQTVNLGSTGNLHHHEGDVIILPGTAGERLYRAQDALQQVGGR